MMPTTPSFSLLLLSDNEVLFDDLSVDYVFIPSSAEAPLEAPVRRLTVRARGTLKVASSHLFFAPDDARDPVVRLALASAARAEARFTAADTPAPGLGEDSAGRSAGRSRGADEGDAWLGRIFGAGEPDSSAAAAPVAAPQPQPQSPQQGFGARVLRAWRWAAREEDGAKIPVGVAGGAAAGSGEKEGGGRALARRFTPRVDETSDHVAVSAASLTLQRAGGADHAYLDVSAEGTHCFWPLYTSAESLLELVQWLQDVARLSSRRARDAALRDAVHERQAHIPFDIAWLDGAPEATLLDEACATITALSRAPGRVRVTDRNLYLMPIHGRSGGLITTVALSSLRSARRMRHGLRDSALEIGYAPQEVDGGGGGGGERRPDSTLMLSFKTRAAREETFRILQDGVRPAKLRIFDKTELHHAMKQWRAGEISNFDYLLFVNLAAGRSFNDLSQYPVFPWVLADYASDELDFTDPATFRDLSQPIGALEPSRRAFFEERFREMPPPRFHYGTHYSTPAYVINYLVRVSPGAMLRLQNGRFDAPDRLFNSIADTWAGLMTTTTDTKELIPEFYAVRQHETPAGILPATSLPTEFLENVQCLDLGTRQDGRRVGDVELPPWADGAADVFLANHRRALESAHVSIHIHEWIDLIFGVNARSPEACNVFYTDVAAGDALDGLDDAEGNAGRDGDAISQLETVFLEFGRTPEQLFSYPHPPRFGALVADYRVSSSAEEDILLSLPPSAGKAVGVSTDSMDDGIIVDEGSVAGDNLSLGAAGLSSVPLLMVRGSLFVSPDVSQEWDDVEMDNGSLDVNDSIVIKENLAAVQVVAPADEGGGGRRVGGGDDEYGEDLKDEVEDVSVETNVEARNGRGSDTSEGNTAEGSTDKVCSDSGSGVGGEGDEFYSGDESSSKDDAEVVFQQQRLVGRSVSALSGTSVQSARRLSITLDPSCAFLSSLEVGDERRRSSSFVAALPRKPGTNASLIDFGVLLADRTSSDSWGRAIVSAWTDDCIRVYVKVELRRSRHVADLTALVCAAESAVYYGTKAGSLGVYNVNSGRAEIIQPSAHDAPVTDMVYCHEGQVLVTASKDATLQLWTVNPRSHVLARLRRYQQLDAEDAVREVTVDLEGSRLFLACLTSADRVLAWVVDLGVPEIETGMLGPIFDLDIAGKKGRGFGEDSTCGAKQRIPLPSRGRLAWVDGAPRKRMLAIVHRDQNRKQGTVRLWKLRDNGTLSAEVPPPDRDSPTTCVLRGVGVGTLFVAGDGFILESDRTGLCLHLLSLIQHAGGLVQRLCFVGDPGTLFLQVGARMIIRSGAESD